MSTRRTPVTSTSASPLTCDASGVTGSRSRAGVATATAPPRPSTASSTGSRRREDVDRAFVLAGGGATGIAWEAGIIIGLRDGGVDVRDADTMIGTSAGSMVAAHLRVGTDEGNAFARIQQGAPLASYGRLGPSDAARYLRAQVHLDQRRGRALVGRAALTARTTSEEEWLEAIGSGWSASVARGPAPRHRGRRGDRHLGRLRQHQRRPARARRRGELRRARRVPRRRGRRPPVRRRRAAQHRQHRPGRGSPSGARAGAVPGRLAPARPARGCSCAP